MSSYLGSKKCCDGNYYQKVVGPQGYQGNPGPIGPVGNQGATGSQGPQGVTGACCRGPQGFQGAIGVQGNQGTIGIQGNQGAQGFQGIGGAYGYWGSFWSTQTQLNSPASTARAFNLNNTDPNSSGVSIVSNSQITFANQGVYNIQLSAQIQDINSPGAKIISIWFRKNGIDIPDSNTNVNTDNQNSYVVAAWNIILEVSAGDYVEIIWYATDSGMQLTYSNSPPSGPNVPSVIVTAQQVMYTQLGPQGFQGNQGFQGDKTFIIDHPINSNKYLVHACLEGPENGVYYRGRGKIENNIWTSVHLPNYVTTLATNFTIHLTKKYNASDNCGNLSVSDIDDNGEFIVYGDNCEFHWIVYGERKPLNVEPNKQDIIVHGNGPYTWYTYK